MIQIKTSRFIYEAMNQSFRFLSCKKNYVLAIGQKKPYLWESVMIVDLVHCAHRYIYYDFTVIKTWIVQHMFSLEFEGILYFYSVKSFWTTVVAWCICRPRVSGYGFHRNWKQNTKNKYPQLIRRPFKRAMDILISRRPSLPYTLLLLIIPSYEFYQIQYWKL